MLFKTAFVGSHPEDALAFIVEILQSSTEYSIIGKDLDGKILLWNEGARRLYGYEAEEVLGTATSKILHPPEDIASGFPGVMMEEASRRGKWEGLLTRVRKNGQRFLARAALTPRFDTAGKHTGYLLISKDITNEIDLTETLSQNAKELSTTNERLSALVDLSLQLGSELDLQRLLQTFGHAAREIIGARYSVTGILDAQGSRLQSLYTSGMDAETAAQLGSPDPRSGVLRTVLREGRCVRVHNPGGGPAALGFSPSRPPIHAWLGAPIASPTRIYGYVGLIDKVGHDEFSKEDERLAGILAAQVGRVYQNGSLYAEVLSHASDLEREMAARERTEKALAERVQVGLLAGEVGAAITRIDSLQEMLQLCAEALVRHLDVAFARIWTWNEAENVLELKASAGLYTHIEESSHRRVPLGELEIGRIADERAPHFTNDVLTDPQVSNKEWAKRENMVSFAGYPLLVEDRLVGVVGMFACQPLNPPTVDAIDSVAHEIALGVERSRANKILREREEYIRLLLDSTAEAVYGIDLQGQCSFANAASARLLGYADPSQLLGRNMHTLIHHTRKDGTPYPVEECRIFRAFRRNQGSHVDDEVLWHADGSSFPAEYWSYPICRDGLVVGSVVTFIDITERKQLEQQLTQAQKLESIGQLAAGIAHEINTPIQYIGDNATFLQGAFNDLMQAVATTHPLSSESIPEPNVEMDYLREEIPKSIAELQRGVEQVARIVRAMKTFSHPGSSQRIPADLNAAIESTVVVSRNEWKYVADVTTDFAADLPLVKCLAGEINQVVLNLIINAAHAISDLVKNSGQKGAIRISTRRNGDWAEIQVADTGGGIPEAIHSRVFDPFFTTKDVGKGTGQGLAIAHSVIVQKHHGTISFSSEIGIGTTFTVRLPME